MELILQKVCGQPAQLPIRLRRCGPADAAAFFALQNEVRAAMPHPEQFVPDTLENITTYLSDGQGPSWLFVLGLVRQWPPEEP